MTDRKNWEIGASSCIITNLYDLTDYAFRHYEQDGVKYAEISTRVWNLKKFGFIDHPEKLLAITDKYGIKIWSFHIPFGWEHNPAILDKDKEKAFMDLAISYIEAGLKIGIKTFVIHPSAEPNEPKDREALIENSIKNLTTLSKLCKDNGAVLALENLPRTCLCNCAAEMIRMVNAVPHLQICFDSNHCLMQDNVTFLDELLQNGMKGKIRTVHISDYDFVDERHWLPKAGVNNWEEILKKLEELEYDGVFMYEVAVPDGGSISYTLEQVKENAEALLGK